MSSEKFVTGGVDRRSFLAACAAGAAATAAATSVPGTAVGRTLLKGEIADAALLATGVGAGLALSGGWGVIHVADPQHGAVRIVVLHEATGRVANVGVCRSAPGQVSMASTGKVDLFLINDGGDGLVLTPDDEVAMVQELALRLQGAEGALPGAARLLGQRERHERFRPADHLADE